MMTTDPRHLSRTTDPETSHAAAAHVVKTTLGPSQRWVLETFQGLYRKDGPDPDGYIDCDLETLAVEVRVGFKPSRVRTARSALTKEGYLRWTGFYRNTPSGRPARIHALTEKGRTTTLPSFYGDDA